MLEGFKREGMQQGVDLDNNTDYLEATKEARADAASQVQESLKGYAEKQVKSGQLTQYAQASDAAREIQTSNAYTQAEKDSVRKKMQELAKKWNIPSELQ